MAVSCNPIYRIEVSLSPIPVPDLLEQLKVALKDQYDVERELGQGGMATVFLASDVKHGRKVAIKVLHEDLAMALGADRFRREIHIATSLSHPHILQLFDSGEADGQLYYVMPFIEGESLRDRINREKILPIEDALRITSEVASALDFAHRKNIIHRDIKPENILLQEGHAVVADFGIARAVNSMNTTAALTQTGVSVGTPTYMSPEQAFAEKDIDGRSDEYSLACVLYEMLTGQPPFTGPNAQSIMARHSMAAVPSMQIVRNTIPDEVEDLVQRALAKSPADRFATLAEFATELQECVIDHATVTRRIDRRTLARPVPKAKQSKRKYIIAGAAAAMILVGGVGAWRLFGRSASASTTSGGLEPSRVAVMYFDDVSPNRQLAYMADGLTESLIDQLAQVQALDVVSKSGASMFKGSDASADSIAKTLNAGTLVRGTVEEEGDRLRVTVRYVDGNSGADLDRKSFGVPKGDVFAMRDSLAREVANFLRQRVGQEVRLREERSGTSNVQAWTLLQRANTVSKDGEDQAANADTTASQRSFALADSLLAQSERLDPRWSDPVSARAGVALAQAKRAGGALGAKPWIEGGIAHADRALAINGRDAEALENRGTLKYTKWRLGLAGNQREAAALLTEAEKDLRAAVNIKPSNATAWAQLSQIYNQKDDFTQAKLTATRAYEEDAYLNGTDRILWRLYATSYDLEQFPDAVKYCEEGGRRFPKNPLFVRCRLWLLTTNQLKPDIPAAWADYAKLQSLMPPKGWEYTQHEARMLIAAGLARTPGLQDSARHVLIAARADRSADPSGELLSVEAFIRTLLKNPADTDEAFKLLQRYLSEHPAHLAGLKQSQSWWWKQLKQDARFAELVGGA
jgi:TolB-like protein/tRNA A-37 threonylcarbamoyl transferase component Bud32